MARTALSGEPSDEPLMISIFLPRDLAAEIIDRHDGATHAVLAQHRERALEGGENADLDGVFRHGQGRDRQSRRQAEAQKQYVDVKSFYPPLCGLCLCAKHRSRR